MRRRKRGEEPGCSPSSATAPRRGARTPAHSSMMLIVPSASAQSTTCNPVGSRAEKFFNLGSAGRRLGVFTDVYNIANSDAAQNIGWNAGSSYLLPVSIIGPRIMRFGAKFDW